MSKWDIGAFIQNIHEGFDSGREKKKLEKQQQDELDAGSLKWAQELNSRQVDKEIRDHGNMIDAQEQWRKEELFRIKKAQEEAKLENIKNPKPAPTPTTTTSDSKINGVTTKTRESDNFPFPDYSNSAPGQTLRADLNLSGQGNADIVFHLKTPDGKIIDVPQSSEQYSGDNNYYGLEMNIPPNTPTGTGEVWVTVNGQEVSGTRKKHEIINSNPVDRYPKNVEQPTSSQTPNPEEFLLDYAPYIEDQSKIDAYYPNGIPQPSPELLDIIRQVSPNDATRSGIVNLTEAGYNMNPADNTSNSNGTIDRGTNQINSKTFDWLQGTPYDSMMQKSGIENYGDMFDPMKNENMKDIIRQVQGYKAWYGPRDKGFKHGL